MSEDFTVVGSEELLDQLAKHQESEFHPDWSMLQASQESLREHMVKVKELEAQLARCVEYSERDVKQAKDSLCRSTHHCDACNIDQSGNYTT